MYGFFHRFLFLFLWFHVICLCQSVAVEAKRDYFEAKRSLMEYLTNNSEIVREILPAPDINTPVNVKLRIKLRQIATLDEKNQALRLTVWLRFDWNNPFLTWNPADYGGIENVHANNEFFWVPDVALFNEASLEEEIEILYKRLATKLVIDKDGNCVWNAPATLLSQCKINVSRFPFDEQECHVSIGSWTYTGYKINLTYFKRNADLSNFIENGEWEIKSALLHNRRKYYGVDKIPYPDVTFTLKVRRRALYYALNIVIPCALIAVLALLSFVLPSDHGERMSLVMTVLLALSVYMLIVSTSLPETSDAVPTLGTYCLGIIMTIACCLFATCITLKCRDMTSPMPRWFEVIVIQYMAKFVLVKVEEQSRRPSSSSDKISVSLNNGKFTKTPEANAENGKEPNIEEMPLAVMNENQSKLCEETLLEELRLITDELRSKQEEEAFAKKWKKAAKILDRFFLMVFLLVYACLIAYLMSSM